MTLTARAATAADVVRAARYERVSSRDQSAARQARENQAACEVRGWASAVYEDPGLSASRFAGTKGGANRGDYVRLLAAIVAGQVDVLVLHETSRADRQLTGWSGLLDACRAAGALIYVTSEDQVYDPRVPRDWKDLATSGIDSAMESEKISMRVTSGKAAGRAAGRPQGSIAYGIRRVRDPEKTRRAWLRDEPHPVTGPIAARIIRAVGAGYDYTGIARELAAEGVPWPSAGRKRQGKGWHAETIRAIARNPVYAAAGVVTEAESLAARARVGDAARKGERPARQQFRYALACGKCGGTVRGRTENGTGYYVCKQGCAKCPAALADPWIDALAIARLSRPDAIGLVRRGDDDAAAAARTEAAGYRQRMAEAAGSYAAGRLTLAMAEAIAAELGPKAEAADKRAADAQTPHALTGLPDGDPAVVADRWESLTIAARKAALRELAPDAVLMPTTKGHPAPIEERVILWPGA